MSQMKITDKTVALSCAIMIFVLAAIALLKGIDGKIMALSLALIGGLGGYGVSRFGGEIIKFFTKFKIEKR